MIQEIRQEDILQSVEVIRKSFATVANEFGITEENGARFTAFATDEERINWHMFGEHRPMYGYYEKNNLIGYYSLLLKDNGECELNNLSVLPEYRHNKIGYSLLEHSFERAKELGCTKMNIGIVEQEQRNLIFFHLPVGIWKKNYNDKFSFVRKMCTAGMNMFLESRKGDVRTNCC